MRGTVVPVVVLNGGLGNQLFQTAYALSLRASENKEVWVDTSYYLLGLANFRRFPRRLEIDLRAVDVPHLTWPLGNLIAASKWARVGPDLSGVTGLLASGAQSSRLPRFAFLKGYWQESTYPTESLDLGLLDLYRTKVNGESCEDFAAAHIRLGDYLLSSQTRKGLGLTSPRQQLELAWDEARALGIKRIRIYTDSPEMLRSDWTRGIPVELAESRGAWDALVEMSQARVLVMSNSTLSWWSAFFATHVQETPPLIYFPLPWTAQSSDSDGDLLLPQWRTYQRLIMDN